MKGKAQSPGKVMKISNRGVIRAPRERIFPLFCPVREKEWIDGWTGDIYTMIRSRSGLVEKDSIFDENSLKKWLFGEKGVSRWVTTLYEPERFRQDFTMYIGDLAVLHRAVRLHELGGNRTLMLSDDTLTFLKEPPRGAGRIFFAAKLKVFSLWLGVMLKYYCEKGKKLPLPALLKKLILIRMDAAGT